MHKRLIILLVSAAVLLGGAGVALWLLTSDDGYQSPSVPPIATKPRTAPEREHRNEAHWLAAEVVREMTRWAARSGGPDLAKVTPSDDSGVSYVVEGLTEKLLITRHIWHPDDYLPVAQMLLAKAPSPTASASSDSDAENLAASLLNPTTLVMLTRDGGLSAKLVAAPSDPALHEQAALMCVTMAYREAAGRFCDIRRELCAATAHLALARVGRPEPGICGHIALAVIEALSQRELAALAATEGLPETGRLAPWRRAIRLRATGDWTASTIGRGASMVEQLAHCRALLQNQSDIATAKWLDLAEPLAAPDWGWIVCEDHLTVENGHRFAREGLGLEFEELKTLWRQAHRREMGEGDLTAALTLSDDAQSPMRVLSLKRWSAFLDRHRAHRLISAHDFMHYTWGEKEAAKEVRELCAGPLAASPLMPLVRMQFRPDPRYLVSAKQTAEMVGRDPSILTPWMWAHYRFGTYKTVMPKAREWWGGIAAPGTALHASIRADLFTALQLPVRDQVERALLLAPHHAGLKRTLANLRGLTDVAALNLLFGDQVEWNLALASFVTAQAKSGEDRLTAYRRMATMASGWNVALAEELVKMKRESEAVIIYEKAFAECEDRVQVANAMEWLVTRYADQGNLARARTIADHGYQVFSYCGIETKARLDERTGDLIAAEKALEALKERYDDDTPLVAFWKRTSSLRPESRSAYEREVARLFPQGQRAATLADFSGAAKTGVEITSNSNTAREYGIHRGHVIVAIDGVACETKRQFLFLRALTANQPLDIIVWDGKAYRQVIANVPSRRLWVDLTDWTGKTSVAD